MDDQTKGMVAIINVFTVQPENQQKLLNMITSFSERTASKCPGFISARFHAGLEGTRVTGIIYWQSQEACNNLWQTPEWRPFLEEHSPLFQHLDSHFYTVVADVLPFSP